MRAINSPVVLLGRLPIFIGVAPKFFILLIITGGPHRRQMGPIAESAARGTAQSSMSRSDGVMTWHCCTNESQTRLADAITSRWSLRWRFRGAGAPPGLWT